MSNDTNVQDFYNNELERVKEKQKNADAILNSQQRLSELNNSYRKRYAKYVEILMVLILSYLFYLGVVMLQKMIPTIPQLLVDVVTVVLIFLISAYLFSASWELYNRSVTNYDELDMNLLDSSGVTIPDNSDGYGNDLSNDANSNGCNNEKCCSEGTMYSNGQCVISSSLKQNFSTLETAYTNSMSFNSPLLKRDSNSQNVIPLQDKTHLVYSLV